MSFRPTPECEQYAIPITTSTGKTYRVILYETAQGFEAQRDELQEKYDTLATENMLEVNELCNQRDAAMDVLEEISLYLSSGIGDENTTALQYKDRILDGIKHLAGHAWEERCKYEKLWKEAEDALMKIEDIFIDGDDTYEDWKSMGQIARTFFEKTYE
jgi:hypothetical protein